MLYAYVLPALFVVIWATGFIVARLIAPHIEPLTFLSLRFVLTFAGFAALAGVARVEWPKTPRNFANVLIAGVLMQGVYLGGVFWSVRHGLPAGISALIAGLQPLLAALLAWPLLREPVGPRRWIGIGLGLCGALLVLSPNLLRAEGAMVPIDAAIACLLAMTAMTFGTFWQKRTGGILDLRSQAAIQFIGGLAITLPAAASLETMRVTSSAELWTGLLWAVFGLSLGANTILLALIKRGAVAAVSSLLYLVPPVAAAMAFILFGEDLNAVQVAGMGIAAIGVAIAN